jgi:hypothetical protein
MSNVDETYFNHVCSANKAIQEEGMEKVLRMFPEYNAGAFINHINCLGKL